MRCFIAIDIPEEVKARIIKIQEKFKDFDIKFVEKQNFHFNLKFLGEISEDSIEKINEKIKNAAKDMEPFEIKIAGLGVFPSKNYIRVIWIGVKEGYQMLMVLAELIENSLSDMFEKENRKFEPHLTLGRVRSGRNVKELARLVELNKDIEIGKMGVFEIKLMQSKLSPKGPTYSEVFSISL